MTAKETPETQGGAPGVKTERSQSTTTGGSVKQLPTWARDLLASPPTAGAGFHGWLFRCARALFTCGRDEGDIRQILENAAAACGRHVPGREIGDAIKNAQRTANTRQPYAQERKPWPEADETARRAITASGAGLCDLWEESPVRPDESMDAEFYADALFPADALLCVAKANSNAATLPRGEWRGRLNGLQYVVPSPMITRTGLNQDGDETPRCLQNTGARRYIVIEADTGTADEQAAILLHLAKDYPLALALHSGGKSVHGWFYAAGQPEESLRLFMRRACRLGADYHTFTRCQLVRLPEGLNAKTGKRQRVYYFNPQVIL
ncbi:MAG: hypothetical protein FGM15_06645 [Chthoniobacterales bacterium]|nr:hypothetical protein [Chthoniobacterales bacterium]